MTFSATINIWILPSLDCVISWKRFSHAYFFRATDIHFLLYLSFLYQSKHLEIILPFPCQVWNKTLEKANHYLCESTSFVAVWSVYDQFPPLCWKSQHAQLYLLTCSSQRLKMSHFNSSRRTERLRGSLLLLILTVLFLVLVIPRLLQMIFKCLVVKYFWHTWFTLCIIYVYNALFYYLFHSVSKYREAIMKIKL